MTTGSRMASMLYVDNAAPALGANNVQDAIDALKAATATVDARIAAAVAAVVFFTPFFTSFAGLASGLQTRFIGTGQAASATRQAYVVPRVSRLVTLTLSVSANPSTAAITFDVLKNGVTTGVTQVVGAGVVADFTIAVAVDYALNDKFDVQITSTSGGTGSLLFTWAPVWRES